MKITLLNPIQTEKKQSRTFYLFAPYSVDIASSIFAKTKKN